MRFKALAAPLLLACALFGNAQAAGNSTRWDATLPTLEGDRFVTLSALPGPVLVNFWGRDCPPCLAELPLLQAFAASHPHWTVVLIATDTSADARRTLQQRGIALPTLRGGPGVAALMRSAGHRSAALPLTLVLRQGERCASHAGALDERSLAQLTSSCAER